MNDTLLVLECNHQMGLFYYLCNLVSIQHLPQSNQLIVLLFLVWFGFLHFPNFEESDNEPQYSQLTLFEIAFFLVQSIHALSHLSQMIIYYILEKVQFFCAKIKKTVDNRKNIVYYTNQA